MNKYSTALNIGYGPGGTSWGQISSYGRLSPSGATDKYRHYAVDPCEHAAASGGLT